MLGLALALAGCGADSTAPSGSINGTYQLHTINGSNLPFTFSNGITLTSDVLTLSADGSYTDVARFSDGRTSTDQGFYTNLNGAISFTSQTASFSFQGSLSGEVLTELLNGYTQVYQKD
jgi:hypothetical protein